MPLTSATLASGLEALTPTGDPNVGIGRFADAWVDYFAESTVLGVAANAGVLGGAPRSAMVGAMAGVNVPGAAAVAIQAGIIAFWTGLLGIEPTIWTPMVPPTVVTPSTIIPPVGNAGISAALLGVFAANVAGQLSLSAAAAATAAAIHAAQAGATVATTTPPAGPIPTPIL